MRLVQLCNWHRVRGGRETVAQLTANVLERRGHEVQLIIRDSRDVLSGGVWRKMVAFGGGFYSRRDRASMSQIIRDWNPDLVHVHGLYPFFSPSMLAECHHAGVPVVFSCHDYSLTCPTDHHLRNGKVCERCLHGREYWCALLNCRGQLVESCAYALRSTFVRKTGLLRDNVDCFISPSKYVEDRLVEAGFPRKRMSVVPNMVEVMDVVHDFSKGEYVAFAGRISREKGVDTLLASAQITGLPLRLAGDYFSLPEIVRSAPTNAQFLGPLNQAQLAEFYSNARFLVVPSIWYEIFGLVVVEGMTHGLPVIASRMGGMPEIVDDGVTGFLFDAGNVEQLASKMKLLWDNPELCQRMGQAGFEKAAREYGENTYYERLMIAYRKAIAISDRKAISS